MSNESQERSKARRSVPERLLLPRWVSDTPPTGTTDKPVGFSACTMNQLNDPILFLGSGDTVEPCFGMECAISGGQEENVPLLTSPTVRFGSDRVWSMSVDVKSSLEPFHTVESGWGSRIARWHGPYFEKPAFSSVSRQIQGDRSIGNVLKPFGPRFREA